MRCLLIGAGSIGQRHVRALRSLRPSVEVIALRSSHGGPLPAGLVNYETQDRNAALAMRPDFAIVAGPAPFHPETAIPLIAAGIPVLLEKPIATDSQGSRALLAAARNNARILVAYVLRHDMGLAKFREALHAGAIGRLVTLHLECGQALADWRPGTDPALSISARRKTGGGVMFELSHEIDAARWLLGDVETVGACADHCGEVPFEVEDAALILLRSTNGVLAVVQIDMARRVALRRYRAVGTAGTLIWCANEGTVWLEQVGERKRLYAASPDRDALYRRQMEHFLAVQKDDCDSVCTLEDGARTLDVVLSAREAAGLGASAG